VAAELRRLGARLIDADAIVYELQRPGEAVYQAIVERFGSSVVDAAGQLDRRALRFAILNNPRVKADLEAIVHPAVQRRQAELIAQAKAEYVSVVIVDIPLLFEVTDPAAFDGIILVDAPTALRRQRLTDDRGLSSAEADQLIAAQLPAEAKRAWSTWIIENAADRETLIRRVDQVWRELQP
jgi:dephospho-CoA kinase